MQWMVGILFCLALGAIDALPAKKSLLSALSSGVGGKSSPLGAGPNVGLDKDGLTLTEVETKQQHSKQHAQGRKKATAVSQDCQGTNRTESESKWSEDQEKNYTEEKVKKTSLGIGGVKKKETIRRTGDETQVTDEYKRSRSEIDTKDKYIKDEEEEGRKQKIKNSYTETETTESSIGIGGCKHTHTQGNKVTHTDKSVDTFKRFDHTEDYKTPDHTHDDKTADHTVDDKTTDHTVDDKTTDDTEDDKTTDHTEDDKITDHTEDDKTTDHTQDDKTTDHTQDDKTSDHTQDDKTTDHTEDDKTTDHTVDDKTTDHTVDDRTTDHTEDDKTTDCDDHGPSE